MSKYVRVKGCDDYATSYTAGANGYAKALQVLAVKGRVHSIRCFNKGAADIYLQMHDSAAAPSDMTTCRMIVTVQSGLYGGEEFGDGFPFANGCYVFGSQSATALTAIAADDLLLAAGRTKEG
jgi:hypothetical protein